MEHKALKISKESVDKLFPKQDITILGYQSPIEIVANQFRVEREKSIESETFKAIQGLDITVHKDELIKALQYDRGQYEKGYTTGYAAAIEDFAERLKNYYSHIKGSTHACLAVYHIDQIAQEMLRGDSDDNHKTDTGI